jgi:two-component system sensor histidine kinase UhpB
MTMPFGPDQRAFLLMMALATLRQKRTALIIGIIALVVFVAAVPFVRVPLAKMPAFIPSYEAALLFIDLVTATLLLDQFIRLRAVSVLVLAAGYLFDALMIVPHALTFPGAFAPTGLLGAKEQTTAWLYVFWHGGFPLFVLAYAFLRRHETAQAASWTVRRAGSAAIVAIAVVALLVLALTLLATRGHDLLPTVMQGSDYSLLVTKGVSPAVWALTFVAMVALWQREQRVVDLWLMLVMWIWLFDIALAAVIGSSRFDLGFYAGRIFGLIAASFLLVTLLAELAKMYSSALGAASAAQKQLAETTTIQMHPGVRPFRREQPEAFIRRQNIDRYRTLLETGKLDAAGREAVKSLLREEEAKRQDDTASGGERRVQRKS